jgi:hypothetical protein
MTTRVEQWAMAEDMRRLESSFAALLDRLERVLSALALTVDAQAAIAARMSGGPGDQVEPLAMTVARLEALAERYRRALHALRDSHLSR